ncbi:MAG: hypothetical protein BZY79_06290 [SAR202 cluster bacterium Casp-Chloro-G4]|nr:(Fe-S)-binding protein [Chloroflexota bacterium]PKB60948.1 MAG: hypothetical protein BZY79_06290 [SAR202 cluster bacterium Casp-Chloro-G4]
MADKPISRNKSGFAYGPYFREMTVQHDTMMMPENKSWLAVPDKDPEPHKVVLYLGCNVLRTSHMIRTVTDVFDLLGVDYVAVGGPAYCCGIVHQRKGDTELSQTMGTNTVKYFERYQPERVVMWCPSCIYYYDDVFQVPASFETLHVTEFLVEQLDKMNLAPQPSQKVALHYHSAHPRRLQEARAAEQLLSALPGVEYIDIGTDDRLEKACSPSSLEVTGEELWKEIVEGQLQAAADAGVTTFANLYHGCQRQICGYEANQPFTVEHYLSVFARALGIEHEDTYKKYMLLGDTDKILADMAPCMQANGVKPEEARRMVDRTFSG